jgi:hypothetical protein
VTLSGRIAAERPDIDNLGPSPFAVALHLRYQTRKNGPWHQRSYGPDPVFGFVEPATGAYRSAVGLMTEAERREVGTRRNGRPRRPAPARAPQ